MTGSRPLTGMDWFLLTHELAMRHATGCGNVCHLVVELDGRLEHAALVDAASRVPEAGWLASLRVRRAWPWGLPRWTPVGPPHLEVTVRALRDEEDVASGLRDDASPFDAPAVWVELVQHVDGRCAVVLSWHHALMDARGAEALVAALAGQAGVVFDAPPPAQVPAWTRLLQARQARNAVFRASFGRLASLGRSATAAPGVTWHRLVLTAEETATFERRARELGAALVPSALVLAAVVRAVDALLAARGAPPRDVVVPMPQDRRRRGALGPVLSNRISILFFRLPAASRVALHGAVDAVVAQLRGGIAARLPDAFLTLLDLCRWLPRRVLLAVVQLPSAGVLATLGFSDVGATLPGLARFADVPVRDAWHLPAHLHPPGFQVVTSRRGGCLEVGTSWVSGVLRPGELARYEVALRADLLGEGEA